MSDDMPMWKGLFEWSMSYQDGTTNTGPSSARPLTDEDRQWLEQALKGAMLDLSHRMQDISIALNEPETAPAQPSSDSTPGDTPTTTTATTTPLEDKERMLDELMEIVESIDQAKDLSSVGGFQTLLHLLSSPHPSLRWRAAEVVATCVQNNPDVQESFYQGGLLPALWPLLETEAPSTPSAPPAAATGVCLLKGMLAVSCQVRGHDASLQWFRQQNGLQKIIEILNTSSESRVQRKCLQMLEYLLDTVPGDCHVAIQTKIEETTTLTSNNTEEEQENRENTVSSGSLLPLVVGLIADSDDGDIRCTALGVLRQLSKDDTCLVEMQKESSGVIEAVQAVQCKLDSLPKEDWGPAEEEAKLAVHMMEELVKKKITVVPAIVPVVVGGRNDSNSINSSDPAERSGSMQLMALPEPQEQE